MIRITVQFFAHARDLSGTEKAVFDLPPDATTSLMMQLLVDRYPALRELKDHLRLAVNCTYASAAVALHDNDEVAVIPPVSGG
jgi:molybdopterin converting factor subunit 1